MNCAQEQCANWTGFGCLCAFLDLEPPTPDHTDADETRGDNAGEWAADLAMNGDTTFNETEDGA